MKKIDRRIKIGTKVILSCGPEWSTVKKIHDSRKFLEINEWVGGFQDGHILKFINKDMSINK